MLPKNPFRLLAPMLAAVALLTPGLPARANDVATLAGMRYEPVRHSLVFTLSAPVTIGTRALGQPERLVVDVPNATLASGLRRMTINDALIKRVRCSQFSFFPPVVRIVIETAGKSEPLLAVQQTNEHLYITLASEHFSAMKRPAALRRRAVKSAPPKPPGLAGEPGLQPLPAVSPLDTTAPKGESPDLRPRYIPAPPTFSGEEEGKPDTTDR